MKSTRNIIVTGVVLLLFSAHSFAQVEKGDTSFGANMFFSGAVAPEQEFDPTGTLVLSYEKYLTGHLSMSIGPALTVGKNLQDVSLLYQVNWVFLKTKVSPYLGFGVDVNGTFIDQVDPSGFDITITTTNIRAGGHGGLKFFFTERANLDFRIRYNQNLSTMVKIGDELPVTQDSIGGILQITVGFNIVIGRKGT